jgi:hypothetical protein
MMKNYMTTGAFARGKKLESISAGKVAAPFPKEKVVMSIYDRPAPHESRCKLKLMSRVVNAISLATLEYLCWSKSLITFDQMDHSGSIPKPGRFSLIVDLLVGMTQLTKALMDEGSGLNLMYLDTFKRLGITRDQLQSSPHPFYRVVPGKQSVPLGRVTLPAEFGDASNYHTETLTFEVVNFSGPYHVILGQPCYIKFMVIPSYAYLKLKIPELTGVITMEDKAQRALDCKQTASRTTSSWLALGKLSLQVPLVLPGPTMPPRPVFSKRPRMPRLCRSTPKTLP